MCQSLELVVVIVAREMSVSARLSSAHPREGCSRARVDDSTDVKDLAWRNRNRQI